MEFSSNYKDGNVKACAICGTVASVRCCFHEGIHTQWMPIGDAFSIAVSFTEALEREILAMQDNLSNLNAYQKHIRGRSSQIFLLGLNETMDPEQAVREIVDQLKSNGFLVLKGSKESDG